MYYRLQMATVAEIDGTKYRVGLLSEIMDSKEVLVNLGKGLKAKGTCLGWRMTYSRDRENWYTSEEVDFPSQEIFQLPVYAQDNRDTR